MTKSRRVLLVSAAILSAAFAAGLWGRAAGQAGKPPATATLSAYDFDPEGRLVAYVDPSGEKASWTYNKEGLLEEAARGGQKAVFAYDKAGNRTSVRDAAGVTTCRYDAFDRLERLTFERPQAVHVDYSYDPWGRVTKASILSAEGQVQYSLTLGYDLAGRVRRVSEGHGAATFEYRPDAREIVRALPNGVKTTFAFAPTGMLASVRHAGADGNPIRAYEYEYKDAPSGAKVVVTETAGAVSNSRTFTSDGRGGFRAPASPANEPPAGTARFIRDADGLVAARVAGQETCHYFSAPLGSLGSLVAEVGPSGKLAKVFVTTELLSLEHGANRSSTYFLERDLTDRQTPQWARMATGQSIEAAPVASATDASGHANQAAMLPADPPRAIFVSGVNSYGSTIRDEVARYVGSNTLTVTTSSGDLFGGGMGAALKGIHADWRIMLLDSLRSAGNYLLAGPASALPWSPEWASGFGGRDLRSAISANPSCETLYAHSNGAITVYNCRQMIADLKLSGQSDITTVVIGGCGLAARLQDYFDRRRAHIKVLDASGGEGFADMVRSVFTTPNVQLSREVYGFSSSGFQDWMAGAGLKVGAIFGAAATALTGHETIGFTAHGIRLINWNSAQPVSLGEVQKELGGIKLDRPAEMLGPVGHIYGAVYDPKSQRIALLGDGNTSLPRLKPQYLAVAFQCVFGDQGEDPAFSLDPQNPSQAGWKWQEAVYIPDRIVAGTDFGAILYDADWLLKQYSFGTKVLYSDKWIEKGTKPDDAGRNVEYWASGRLRTFTQEKRKVEIPGFRNVGEISLAMGGGDGKPVMAREWILPREVTLKKVDGACVFQTVKMAVEARKQELVNGKLQDSKSDEPLAREFARIMTELYDQVAEVEPSFAEVRELAKVMAVAKWLKANHVPVDLDWANRIAADRHDVVRAVTRLDVQHEKKTVTETPRERITETLKVLISGGVSLEVDPQFTKDDGAAQRLQEAVPPALAEARQPLFAVGDGSAKRAGLVLPMTKGGALLYGASGGDGPSVEFNEVRYQFDAKQRVVQGLDKSGNRAAYRWDDSGTLVGVDLQRPSGWTASIARTPDGVSLTARSPADHSMRWDYGNDQKLKGLAVDGKEYARLDWSKDGRQAVVRYLQDSCEETLTQDDQGRLVSYARTVRDEAGAAYTQRLSLERDAQGLLTSVDSEATGKAVLRHADGLLRSVQGPGGALELDWKEGQIAHVAGPGKTGMDLSYAGKGIDKGTITADGRQAEAFFENGYLRKYVDLDGSMMEFLRLPDGVVTKVIRDGATVAQLDFDSARRLVGIEAGDIAARVSYYPPSGEPGRGSLVRHMEVEPVSSQRTAPPAPPQPPAAVDRPGRTPTPLPSGARPTARLSTAPDGKMSLAVGEVVAEEMPTMRQFEEAGTSEDKDGKASSKVDQFWRKNVEQGRDGPVLLVYDQGTQEAAVRMAASLNRVAPGHQVVLTKNPALAEEKLNKVVPVRSQPPLIDLTVVLHKKSLEEIGALDKISPRDGLRTWGSSIDSLADAPTVQDNILVLAHDGKALAEELEADGKKGLLQGKFVILVCCGEEKSSFALAQKLVEEYGAVVWMPARAIEPGAIAPLFRNGHNIIAGEGKVAPADMIRMMIEHLLNDPEQAKDLEKEKDLDPKWREKIKLLLDGVLLSLRDRDRGNGRLPLAA